MSRPRLSIIIPAYQEAARIQKTLDDLAVYLTKHRYDDTEVVVVVADSPDGTAKLAQDKAKLFKQFRVVNSGPKVGKGRDVRTGILEAAGEYKLFMDADLATPLHYIKNVRQLMDEGAPVIIAVRNLTNSHTGLRKLVSSLGNGLVQVMLLPGISDTQCGFKAFSYEAADELFRRQTILGWGFDMEILAIARMLKYKIAQIQAPDWSDKPNGTFEGEVTSAAFETLGELLTIVWRRWTGQYKHKHYNYEPHSK
jgi:glycosyltransferase involved in cell wall biosynthesis